MRRNLGWFGDLALNPDNGPDLAARAAVLAPARRSALTSAAILVAGVGAGSAGFILLVLFFVLWRQMRSHFTTGSPFGGVYAETFALWLALFVGLHLIGGFLPENAPRELLSGIAVLVSLSAMVWPLLRGVPWRRMCDDIGWRWGDRPALEPFFGVVCYLAALPVVIVLVLALFALLQLGPKWITAPTHPIVFKVLQSGWWGWIQALFFASVVAPLMEETMFRGVLYRHLREATGRLGRGWSVVLSALVVSFVFAALHPQGVLAIPVLMTLAFGFTAAREWRGTLVPSMTVHALHNGALMLALILAAG